MDPTASAERPGDRAAPRARIGGVRWPDGEAPPELLAAMKAALGPGAELLVLDRPGGAAGRWRGAGRVADGDAARVSADIEGEVLVLRRDPIGHRSLYLASPRPGVWVFASTIHGVLASGVVPRVLAVDRVPLFLAYAYVPGRRTLVEGVEALDPGEEVRVADGLSRRRCWEPPAALAEEPDEVLRDGLRGALEAVVSAQLPDDESPQGVTLSGGIDSSLVLALLRRLHRGPVRSFSVSFGPPHADELAWSGKMARHAGVEQQVVLVRPDDVTARFDATVTALSSPNGDPLTVPNHMLFEAASSFSPDLWNGEGGDPCFGGPKNAPMLLAELLEDDSRELAYLRAHQRMVDDLPSLLAVDPRIEAMCAELTPWFDGSRGFLDELMAINIVWKGAWHILPKVDHLGALFGVRPRSPLFHSSIVERSFTLPGRLKRAGAVEKYLLKEAVRDVVPAEILERPKSGMMVPVEAWFSGPLRAWAETRILDGLGRSWLFRRGALEDLLRGRRLGLRPRRGIKLWLLLTLEAWLRGHGVALP